MGRGGWQSGSSTQFPLLTVALKPALASGPSGNAGEVPMAAWLLPPASVRAAWPWRRAVHTLQARLVCPQRENRALTRPGGARWTLPCSGDSRAELPLRWGSREHGAGAGQEGTRKNRKA